MSIFLSSLLQQGHPDRLCRRRKNKFRRVTQGGVQENSRQWCRGARNSSCDIHGTRWWRPLNEHFIAIDALGQRQFVFLPKNAEAQIWILMISMKKNEGHNVFDTLLSKPPRYLVNIEIPDKEGAMVKAQFFQTATLVLVGSSEPSGKESEFWHDLGLCRCKLNKNFPGIAATLALTICGKTIDSKPVSCIG